MPYSDFISYLSSQKRNSIHTIKSYTTDLKDFYSFCEIQFDTKNPVEINSIIIRSWFAGLMEQGYDARSVNRKLSALRSYFNFLLKQNVVKINPVVKVRGPKVKKRLPVYVDESRMNELFIKVSNENDFKHCLEIAIVEIFYATGIRLSELTELKIKNVNEQQIKVLGKRNKERILPLTDTALEAIENYRLKRNKLEIVVDTDYFFVMENGKKVYQKFVYRLINRYLALITTDKKKSPHVLRHTFATHLLNNGAGLNAVKEMLGHASLAATQVYTHNTINKLINIHQKAHPLEKRAG